MTMMSKKVAINEGPAANVDVDSRWYVESPDKILELYVEYSKQKSYLLQNDIFHLSEMSYLNSRIIPNSIRWILEGIVRDFSIPEHKQR